ncbi:serine/threonine-protein kinase PLK4-like [Watersipora subatra]|uniref:serine/threonine-protein kinase PLK4-like n=1 Tax=Watersipora subatra TaxID=2589382 RepID=UPI00355BBE3B
MASLQGESIEDFQVLNLIGRGGFACVYRARSVKTGEEVAIKMIDKKLMKSNNLIDRVKKEVEIHSRLKHPAVLELYSFFEDSNYVYLVLEMCHNGELYRHMKDSGQPFSEKQVRVFMTQIVAGMKYLHQHSILHRDLSLTNLLLSRTMTVKIADFGLAAHLKTPSEQHYTMCGTPNYISPEVAQKEAHGLEADVWSLGCMFYTLLVGKPPFDTHAVKSTIHRVIIGDYEIPPGISREAADLIECLLQKLPADRIKLNDVLNHPFFAGEQPRITYHPTTSSQDSTMDSGRYTLNSTSSRQSLASSGRHGDMSSVRSNLQQLVSSSYLPTNKVKAFLDTVQERDNSSYSANDSGVGGRSINNLSTVASCFQNFATSQSQQDMRENSIEQKNIRRRRSYHSSSTYVPGQYSYATTNLEDADRHSFLPKQESDQRSAMGSRETSWSAKSNYEETKETSMNSMLLKAHVAAVTGDSCIPPPCQFAESNQSGVNSKLAEQDIKPSKSTDCVLVPAFNSIRLRPIRQKTRNAILSVLEDGTVCIEFLKSKSPCAAVSEVIRISSDGQQIIVYKPKKEDGPVPVDPSSPPALPAHYSQYSYSSLPRKYWRKYEYGARFISLLKRRTPKVTYFSQRAKCMLMESGEDFEAVFYEGPKFTITAGMVQVIDSSGMNITMEAKSESKLLSAEMEEMWQHVKTCQKHCTSLEQLLESTNHHFTSASHFPAVIGNRTVHRSQARDKVSSGKPLSPSPPSITSSNIGSFSGSTLSRIYPSAPQATTQVSTKKCLRAASSGSRLSSLEHSSQAYSNEQEDKENWHRKIAMVDPVYNSCDALQRNYLKGLGWVSQMKNGSLWCHFDDGTQLMVPSQESSVQFVSKSGAAARYDEADLLPHEVKEKLKLLPTAISFLTS